MTYFDHCAGSPVRPAAREAMLPWLAAAGVGNPSSVHAAGRRARRALSEAREDLGRLLGAPARDLLFTSGGTEADNLALRGTWEATRHLEEPRGRLVISAVEHPAVRETARHLEGYGAALTILPVGPSGRVDPSDLEAVLGPDVLLVSVMAVQNETGVVQPIPELAAAARAAGALFHCDAVQALGRIPVDLSGWGVDLASFSGHKLGGPAGIGLLFRGPAVPAAPLLLGGTQQGGRRAGTEPVALVSGLRAAASALSAAEQRRLQALDRRLVEGLAALEGAALLGRDSPRAPGIVSVAFPGTEGDTLVMALDQRGLCVSSGAACASGAREPSPALTAMGLPGEVVRGAVRVSLGWSTTEAEVDLLLEVLPAVLGELRAAAREDWS